MRIVLIALVAAVIQAAAFVSTVNAADTYAVAYKSTQETGKPLVVLIGADWCPACQTMKRSVMPKLESAGGLKDVAFTIVDTDRQGELARSMMQGNSIPQLVMYTKTDEGWKRQRLVGGQSVEAVRRFLSTSTPHESKVASKPARDD